jgi:hypothetical protein
MERVFDQQVNFVRETLARIRTEYLELPGLTLTPRQLQRLCNAHPQVCDAALAELVAMTFLKKTKDGSFQRVIVR